jgi:hypothetical protein
VYYEHQFGNLRRKNSRDGSAKAIKPKTPKGEPALRYDWMTPFVISHHRPFTLYYSANRLFKSINKGDDLICISPDLTTHPGPDEQGHVPYRTVTTISESPVEADLTYTGTDDGNVQVTRDEGTDWTKISGPLPDRWISRVATSQHELGTVCVSLTWHREDNFEKYLCISRDFGRTWESIVGHLPSESINVIAEDLRDQDILYMGADLGVYTTLDGGKDVDFALQQLTHCPCP